jgi:hypothetical protein
MGKTAIHLDCTRLGSDLAEVDRLARLHLNLRRQGVELRLANPDPVLVELLCFCGLGGLLGVGAGGEAEQGEEPFGVEEEGDLGDPSV